MIRCALVALLALSFVARARADEALVRVQLLGLNDFHGQLTPKQLGGRPVGGAPVLAAYLRAQQAAFAAGESLIVHAGDWVGASPPESALLQDEPAIEFLNLLGNRFCTRSQPLHPRCDVVGTPGNHEFDEGVRELLRLVLGGNHARGPFLARPWRGARVSYVSANVLDRASGAPILPPYAIKRLGPVRLGVIGATLQQAPTMVVAGGVARVRFVAEAEAINRQVRALVRRGVHAIVLTIHQGGPQAIYEGPTRSDVAGPSEGLAPILSALDDEIDVVVSGHAHAFTNALMRNAHGHPILVTQALSAGQAFSVIELAIDARTGDVVDKSARVIVTYGDRDVPDAPRADVEALVERAKAAVAPFTVRVIGHAPSPLPSALDAAGNSLLGNLIADAQRSAVKADIALMNQGGIRTGVEAGEVTWGELFAVQPFNNLVMALSLRGERVRAALEQQWLDSAHDHRLTVSGLRYTWDPQAPPGARVRNVRVGERELEPNRVYRVAVNNFLADGGSGFTMFRDASKREVGPPDLEALIAYIQQLGGQLPQTLEPRSSIVGPSGAP